MTREERVCRMAKRRRKGAGRGRQRTKESKKRVRREWTLKRMESK